MQGPFFFSPSTLGFYLKGMHRNIPADAVEISGLQHASLIKAQAERGPIGIDRNGKPVAARAPSATARRALLLVAIRAEARRRIETISPVWRQMNDMRTPTPASQARFATIDAIRAASALIEQDLAETANAALGSFPITDHPLWPETR
jgi:hypothetical protein